MYDWEFYLQKIMIAKKTKMDLDLAEQRENELSVDDVEMANRQVLLINCGKKRTLRECT